MISEEARKMIAQNKEFYEPYMDWKTMDYSLLRQGFEETVTRGPLPEGITVKDEILAGRPVERIFFPNASEKIIMHIHGGGMVMGNEKTDRFMLSQIGIRAKRNTISVDYRLCPEYAYPAAVNDCAGVYRALLEEGHEAKDIALLGESAGGMLVLALLAYIKKNEWPMPGCACVISGSADAQYRSQSMERNKASENVVNLNLKEMMQEIYYKTAEPNDPVASPIDSDLSGWPPVYFHACREEILLDESIRMYVELQKAGVETDITIVDELFHTYMVRDIPESYAAFENIAAFFLKHEM